MVIGLEKKGSGERTDLEDHEESPKRRRFGRAGEAFRRLCRLFRGRTRLKSSKQGTKPGPC